jgi:hypothetical protein
MKKNSNDYSDAIKKKYHLAKAEIFEGFLLEPSPASLRDFCLLLLERGLIKKDQEIFYNFFKPNSNQDLKKVVENFDVDKLKTICNFLKGISKNTSFVNLNFIAVLVDFEPRPFSKFLSEDKTDSNFEKEFISDEVELFLKEKGNNLDKVEPKKKSYKNAIGVGVLSVLGVFGLQQFSNKTKSCMQWQENKYVVLDCSSDSIKTLIDNPVLALDKNSFQLKKVNPYHCKPYFKYRKPNLWYHKMNGEIEYFNRAGKHPITGKDLKPITPYMIKKYLKEE